MRQGLHVFGFSPKIFLGKSNQVYIQPNWDTAALMFLCGLCGSLVCVLDCIWRCDLKTVWLCEDCDCVRLNLNIVTKFYIHCWRLHENLLGRLSDTLKKMDVLELCIFLCPIPSNIISGRTGKKGTSQKVQKLVSLISNFWNSKTLPCKERFFFQNIIHLSLNQLLQNSANL